MTNLVGLVENVQGAARKQVAYLVNMAKATRWIYLARLVSVRVGGPASMSWL